MIKIIVSMPIDHDNEVKKAVDYLQENNWKVEKIERIKKGFMFFSDAVTHITYSKLNKIDLEI